jgi:hypothetical protein
MVAPIEVGNRITGYPECPKLTSQSLFRLGEYHLKYSLSYTLLLTIIVKINIKSIKYVISAFTLKIVVILKLFAITINLPLKLDFIEDIKIKAVVAS